MPAVDVNLISTVGRIRGTNEAQVAALVDSIAAVGLLNPVTVYRRQITRSGETVDGYALIAGGHRLEACKRLGLAEIEATIVDLDEPHRVLAECDENLCGTTLTAAERAEFTARRKWAYEQIHPETVNGRNQHSDRDGKVVQPSFADDQADKTGKTARSVRRDAERGTKVCNSALALIKGTHLDRGAYLDQLKGISPEDQVRRVKADLARRDPVSTSRQSKIDADVKDRAAKAIAEFISENSDSDQWDGLKADLYAAGAKNIADALSNIVGNSMPYREIA